VSLEAHSVRAFCTPASLLVLLQNKGCALKAISMPETGLPGVSSNGAAQKQLNESKLTSNKTSFSNILSSPKNPTKEDAIILDSIDGLSIHSYTVAIGQIIEPKIFFSLQEFLKIECACT